MAMKGFFALCSAAAACLLLAGCGDPDGDPGDTTPPQGVAGDTIADQDIAHESVLRSIPVQYVNTARTTFHVAYQHTSHGNQTAKGVWGLQDYKAGDEVLFGVQGGSATPDPALLDFHDCYHTETSPLGTGGSDDDYDVSDLSNGVDDGTFVGGVPGFVAATRGYLDDPGNADTNAVMWSWCSISGHTVQNYLDGMAMLINEYGPGGTKIGTGAGQRATSVNFIFMTGHAEGESNEEEGSPGAQADLILDFCVEHGYFCLDYYGIDTHDFAGTYYPAANDDGVDTATDTAFYGNWQAVHAEGVDWYNNLTGPGGDIEEGDHNTQHITANRKAYAFWWILARLAGWDGVTTE
jgi:hypothetical protein